MAYSKSLKENLKALKESKVSDERVFPDTGEVSVVSKTGAYGVRIFIDARAFGGNPTLKLDISASYDGPYTPEAHKERPVDSDNIEKEIKQNIAELKRVLQRGIDRLDDDLSSALKKMGYK